MNMAKWTGMICSCCDEWWCWQTSMKPSLQPVFGISQTTAVFPRSSNPLPVQPNLTLRAATPGLGSFCGCITVVLYGNSLTVMFLLFSYRRRRRLCFHFGLFVCLFVSPSDKWKSCEQILAKFLGGVGHGPGTNEFNFGDDPDRCPDPGVRSLKSAFTGLTKKLPTDFAEILWRAGVWLRDQLITFWWRSASLSGSGSPFQITLRIREELPCCQHTQNRCHAKIIQQFYYAGVRRRSVLSEYF